MIRPSFANIETLIWIHRLGSFKAAADKLYTTQPAVSARMRELENSLGFELFERRGRSVKLTVAARRFVARTEPILHELEIALFDEELKGALAGQIHMGVGEISAGLFADVHSQLRAAFPRVSFDLELDLADRLHSKLRQGLLDFSFVLTPTSTDELIYQHIVSTTFIWATSPEVAARIKAQTFADVAGTLSIWCVPADSWAAGYPRRVLSEQGLLPENVNTSPVLGYMVQFLLRGDAVACIPELAVAEHLRSGRLRRIDLPGDAPEIHLYLAWQRKSDGGLVGAIGRELTALLHNEIDLNQ